MNIINSNLTFTKPVSAFSPLGTVKNIVIHHVGSGNGITTPEAINSWHINNNGWPGAGYHYYIRQNRSIYIMRPDHIMGAHVKNNNGGRVGVCFEGNFERFDMPLAQLNAGAEFLAYLLKKYRLSVDKIKPHKFYNNTSCPGLRFPWNKLISLTAEYSKSVTNQEQALAILNQPDPQNIITMPPAGAFITHIVVKGDTLYKLSQKYGVSIETIIADNPIITGGRVVQHKGGIGLMSIDDPDGGGGAVLIPGWELQIRTNIKYNTTTVVEQSKAVADDAKSSALGSVVATITEEENKKAYDKLRANTPHQTGVGGQDKTTLRGGKKRMDWEDKDMILPGYHNAVIQITLPDGTRKNIEFLISPSSFSDSRNNVVQPNRTNAGWFLYKLGPGLTQLGLSGYMLDTKHEMERLAFLQDYKHYVIDKRASNYEFINENVVSMFVEGTQYIGYITAFQTSKSSMQPFLYQYSIQFLSVEERQVYNPQQALSPPAGTILTPQEKVLADGTADLISGETDVNAPPPNLVGPAAYIKETGKTVEARIIGSTMYTPVRAFTVALGYAIHYDASAKIAYVGEGTQKTTATGPAVYVRSTGRLIASEMIGDTMYAPVRALAEALGHKVNYNTNTKVAYIV